MSQIPNENDDDNCSVVGSDFVQIDQSDEVPDQEIEAAQHVPLDWAINTETATIKELKLMMANLEAKNQMLQEKVENLELKAENRALKAKENAEENNESFQHQQTKGIPYDVQLTKTDNETLFGFKILTRENHHFITSILPESVAMHSGLLHVGDCITAINGTCVDSMTTQELVQFIRAAGNQLTITVDPNYRMENYVGVYGDGLLDSSADSGSGGILELLVGILCILMAIFCGLLLYGILFPENSKNALMAEKSDAAYLHKQIDDFRDRIGQLMGVLDCQKAFKSQNETIAELRAKNGQQTKEINQMIKEVNAHKDMEKLHIQIIEALRVKIDHIDKEHSGTIGQKVPMLAKMRRKTMAKRRKLLISCVYAWEIVWSLFFLLH